MNKTLTRERRPADGQLPALASLPVRARSRPTPRQLHQRRSSESRIGKTVWRIFHELDGVLPAFWSNLAELIVADINCKLTGEDER